MRQYRKASAARIVTVSRLPRKASTPVTFHTACTVNRHRWARRGSSGARENHGQGTRQNYPVTSGKGDPSDRAQRNGPGDCLTKTYGFAKSKDEE